MKRLASLLLLIGVLTAPTVADDLDLGKLPPVVVKTVPQAGTDDVDPKTTAIHVTFSKDMADGSWSWVTITPESFPKIAGKLKFLPDRRTAVMPVALEPGKTYALWINSEKHNNFKDVAGRSAVPYLVTFRTKK